MQSITNFINLLGENYYLDFILEPHSEEIDYEKHFVLVHYQDKKYYEQSHEYIEARQNNIINNLKELFQKSISDIFLEVSKMKKEEIEKFLNFNIDAVNVKLNIIKNDFNIGEVESRYTSVLYDVADMQKLESFYTKRENSSDDTNIEIKKLTQSINALNKLKNTKSRSEYFSEFYYQRVKLLTFLPFKLFHIATKFVIELERIKELNVSYENSTNSNEKLKWIGKPSQLGFIIGKLADLGYIDTPKRLNGEINYKQFANLVNNTFEVNSTNDTLSKYLNLESEKGKETVRKFDNYDFKIPHIKEIS